jgi:hypothetical protein
MYVGGATDSSTLSGKSFTKAYYTIYSSSISILESYIIGTGTDFDNVNGCAYDSVSGYVAFLVENPTMIVFVLYGAAKVSSNIVDASYSAQDLVGVHHF